MKLSLLEKRQETNDVTSFIFEPQEPVEWQAGQYITLTVPHDNPDDHGTEHYFTISSAPFEGRFQITTRLTGSTFKNALNALPLGSQLEATGPEGDFTLENPFGQYVFVAGGIGITPFHSILKQFNHEGKTPQIQLLYGNRNADAVFKSDLESFTQRNSNFTVQYLIDPEKISAETVRTYVADLQTPTFYISGPEPMVEALEQIFLNDLGIPEERMKRDYFPGYDQHNF